MRNYPSKSRSSSVVLAMTLLLLRTGVAEPSRQLPDPDGQPAAASLDLERLDRSPADHTKKVRVFILMGQSNMKGMPV